MPADSTILAVQTEVGLEDLAAEDDEGFSADTVVALEQYASKVSSQRLTAHSSLGPAKAATSAWAWPRLLPQPLSPRPRLIVHILIQGVRPAWPAGRQLFPLTLVCAASAGEAAVSSGDIRNPGFALAARKPLRVTFISFPRPLRSDVLVRISSL